MRTHIDGRMVSPRHDFTEAATRMYRPRTCQSLLNRLIKLGTMLFCKTCAQTSAVTDVIDIADKPTTIIADLKLKCGHQRESVFPVRESLQKGERVRQTSCS